MRAYKITYREPNYTLKIDYIENQNRLKALNEWVAKHPQMKVLAIEYVHDKNSVWIFQTAPKNLIAGDRPKKIKKQLLTAFKKSAIINYRKGDNPNE